MSAPRFYAPNGALFSIDTHITITRWGGGADDGMYHVFLVGAGHEFFTFTRQAVVDDFGTLVPVNGARS